MVRARAWSKQFEMQPISSHKYSRGSASKIICSPLSRATTLLFVWRTPLSWDDGGERMPASSWTREHPQCTLNIRFLHQP